MFKFIRCFFFSILFFTGYSSNAQSTINLNLQLQSDVPLTCGTLPMTMIHDQLGNPFMYVANKSAGLSIYMISNLTAPVFMADVPIGLLDSLHVMSITQEGNFLYLALGNFFGGVQSSGMAIIDVTAPIFPVIMDVWNDNSNSEGASFVAVEGNYAYLAAMGHGLTILDITDKNNIVHVSTFTPSILFPDPNPDPAKYNARGLAIKNDLVYLAYDAGGMRIIDVSDKNNPVQTGQYSNSVMNALPRAYNNLILDDSLLFITVDYCGLEILNISDTSNITQVSWWNPWACPTNNWFTSPGHTNEIAYDKDCGVVFMSTGKSEMYAVDITDPNQPDSITVYGNTTNNLGTWGVSQFDNRLMLSYICTFGIPFPATWPGIKILTYDNQCIVGIEEEETKSINVYPVPSKDVITFELENGYKPGIFIEIYNASGKLILLEELKSTKHRISLKQDSKGLYLYKINTDQRIISGKLLIK